MLESVKNVGFGGADLNTRLAKILEELQGQGTTVLAGAAAGTKINVPGMSYQDTLRSVIAFNAGVPTDQSLNASVVSNQATGTLTLAGVVAGDTATINSKVFTAVVNVGDFASSPAPYSFEVGATDTDTAVALAKAINSAAMGVSAASTGAVVTITANLPGVAGNAYTTVGGTHITASGATLTGGATDAGFKVSVDTTGQSLMVIWNKKPS